MDASPTQPPERTVSGTPDHPPPPPLARARAVSRVMDDLVRVPGTSWRVGLDPVLGLLPGAGDWISWAISLQILWAAVRMGAGAPLVARMLGNVVVDAVVGAVPLAGDLFDVGWKANRRNLRLLEAHARDPVRTAASSRLLAVGILAGSVAVLAGAAWGAWWVLQQVAGLLG